MATIIAALDPITRIEGHLKVNVEIETVGGVQQVIDAWCVGTLFRGFETILAGRDPRDAPLITSRICGVCPTAHAKAASLALDAAFGVTPPEPARLLRNLVHGACFLESDILHFYLLSLPDYIRGPGMAPWLPAFDVGLRLDRRTSESLLGNYMLAIEKRRRAHEMGAIYGGKLPHTPAYLVGGFTAVSTADDKAKFQAYLADLITFIRDVYIRDVEELASFYRDYFQIGRGYGNLISFGAFRLDTAGTGKLFLPGRVTPGTPGRQALDVGQITEQVTHSWYDQATDNRPPASGETLPQYPKQDGYSWLKAPRYGGVNYECGPLARMSVNGEYSGGVSVMDRHLARAREALKIATNMQAWLEALPVGVSAYTPVQAPAAASSMGLTEAPRGALGHWLQIQNGVLSRYQIITPTCWNCSPRDTAGNRGPLEQALIGTPVERVDQPVEVLRVIHSFDPCLDCATHVMRAGEPVPVFTRREGGA